MSHEELKEAAENAINAVFSDQSVSRDETINSLYDLAADIRIKIESLEVQE